MPLRILLVWFAVSCLSCAGMIVAVRQGIERQFALTEEKFIHTAGFPIRYLDGGRLERPVIVLIHGFAGNKDQFSSLNRELAHHYRIIAFDVPGFGENGRFLEEDYSIKSQANRLKSFLTDIKVPSAHIVGNAMGGAIATQFALDNPERTLTLTLLSASGIKPKSQSELDRLLAEGKNPLLVRSLEDYNRYLQFTMEAPPFLPPNVKKLYAEKAIQNRELNEIIFQQLQKYPYPFEGELSKISVPTLILWGDKDRVLDPSLAQSFHNGIKGSKFILLQGSGNILPLEKPALVAEHLLKFLRLLELNPP